MKPHLVLLSAVLVLGCKGTTGPAGPPGQPVLPGTIRGIVSLYPDLSPRTPAQDAGGVTVLFQPHNLSTITLADGSWELTQVPMGVYSAKFTKRGCFTENIYNFQFVAGGGTYFFDNIHVSEVSSISVHCDSLTLSPGNSVGIYGAVGSSSSFERVLTVMVSRSPMDTSFVPFEFDYIFSRIVDADSINFNFYDFQSLSPPLLGSTVYAVVFVNNGWFPSRNPLTGRYIFDTPGVLFSEQKSVVEYSEELTFTDNKKDPVIHFEQKTWIKSTGAGSREPLFWESGFLLDKGGGIFELVSAQKSGRMEILRGKARRMDPNTLELPLTSVSIVNDDRMIRSGRTYTFSPHKLTYELSMSTTVNPSFQKHVAAQLTKMT
ncbi:MAG: heme-binding beta-barrel domain-containing protein [Bacteroidota bacterium]